MDRLTYCTVGILLVFLTWEVTRCNCQESVCYRTVTRYNTAYRSVVSGQESYACGLFGWSRCTRSRYSQQSYSVSSSEVIFGCCAGYSLCGTNRCCQFPVSEANDSVPFVDVRIFANYLELDKTKIDSFSDPIYIPGGVLFGNEVVSVVYVNENGIISFRDPWKYSYPNRFPTDYFYSRKSLSVAPFWSDNDIRLAGAVRYASISSNDTNEAGQALFDIVNRYVRTQPGKGSYSGRWLLVVHWDNVHPSPHGDSNQQVVPTDELEKINNYQAIIVTDGISTYAIFSYMCGELQWSGLGRSEGAVVGFNAEGSFYGNHPLSGYPSIGESISCPLSAGSKRRKRQQDGSSDATNLLLPMPADENVNAMRSLCESHVMNDSMFVTAEEIPNLASIIPPCPCTRKQADNDANFMNFPSGSQCYVSQTPNRTTSSVPFELVLTQQCCYGSSELVTSIEEGMVGTLLLHHPVFEERRYIITDRDFREACCGTGEVESLSLCQNYIDRRPINNCSGYQAPAICTGSGDPHYLTIDGRYYTFNGFGEFVLLEALSENLAETEYTLQGRLASISRWRVTTQQSLAFGNSLAAFHFGLTPGFRVFQTRPEPAQEITHLLQNGRSWIDSTHQAVLIRNNNELTVNFVQSRIALVARVVHIRREYYINFQLQLPQSFSRRIRGFFGNFDGDRTNDFFRRGENIPLPNNIGERSLLNEFRTWQVMQEESLFYYGRRKRQTGENFEDFQNSSFVPIFSDELNFTDAQRTICDNNPRCLFDFAVTGEIELALDTLQDEKNANISIEALNNFPPTISADSLLQINIGFAVEYTLTVVDPIDNVILSIEGGLPDNSALTSLGDGTYVFRWNLEEPTTKTLVFIANDSRGAAASFVPRVEVCACKNGGVCTLDGVLTSNSTILLHCLCTEAFSGRFCEEDRNGCSEIQCFEGVECMDVPAPGVGAMCGPCPPGYTGDTSKCYDIDECSESATLCEQICTNTDGSYLCSCMDGFELIEGTNQCRDVDECDKPNDCQQMCNNTNGSYICGCSEGFSLALDGRNCEANQACVDNSTCSDICAVVNGVEECHCPVGFELSAPGGTQCVDRDECLNSLCEQSCVNTVGSFECTCREGFELEDNRRTCQDVNECLEAALIDNDLCENDNNTDCVNLDGSYACICVSGYRRENGVCREIENESPPPPPRVIIPSAGIENSANFTSPTLSSETFTPRKKQQFREVTATAIDSLCIRTTCNLVLPSGESQPVSNLDINPLHVAIPTTSISENDEGKLQFIFYVQHTNGFLFKDQLETAVMEGEDQYRATGFLPGANFTLPEIIYLTEGETKDICMRVSRDNDDNQRNITFTFSVHPFNTTSVSTDYEVVNEPTVIPIGVLKTCLQLEAVDDSVVEGVELFTVTAQPTNPSDMVNGSTTVIISDNDGMNLLVNQSVVITEGGMQTVCVIVSDRELSRERDIPVAVSLIPTSKNSAEGDLLLVMESAFIPPGAFEACLQLVAADDDKAESDEVFTIAFKAMNPNDIVNGNATATISDNDGVRITIDTMTVFIAEGGMEEVCVSVSDDQESHEREIPISLEIRHSGNDTTDGGELTVLKEEISILVGDLGACFVVAATDYDDQELKSDKYLTMKVKTVNPYDMVIGNETVVVIITDNNALPRELEVNSVVITLTEHTAITFDTEQQQLFKEATAKAVNEFCFSNAIGKASCEVFDSSERSITAEDIVLKNVRNNDQGQVEFSMFVHSSRGTAVISANSLMNAVKAATEIYIESGYSAPIVSLMMSPVSTHPSSSSSHLSGGGLAAIIFVVMLVVALIIIATGAILVLFKQHGYLKTPLKFRKKADSSSAANSGSVDANYIATNRYTLSQEKSDEDVDDKIDPNPYEEAKF